MQVNAGSRSAETSELAHQIGRSIDINVTPRGDGLSIRTLLPDTREMGRTRIEVNYVLTIPRDANIVCRNHFGDTLLQNVGGNVAIDSAYGVIELRNIDGEVNVRARGEALQAQDLAKGGTFELLGCQAEFSNIAGNLRATNFMGSVVLRSLGTEATVDITNANGPVHMYGSEFDVPGLQCEVLFGELRSHIPLGRTSSAIWSDAIRTSNQNGAWPAHLVRRILIVGRPRNSNAAPGTRNCSASLKRPRIRPGAELSSTPSPGRCAWKPPTAPSPSWRANTLLLRPPKTPPRSASGSMSKLENRIRVQTTVRGDMTALGCSYYRVDLLVRRARALPCAPGTATPSCAVKP